MIFTWFVFDPARRRLDDVEHYELLDAALADMAALSWEDDNPHLLSYVATESGVIAMAVFGTEMALLVSCADGRQLTYPMPDNYKEAP